MAAAAARQALSVTVPGLGAAGAQVTPAALAGSADPGQGCLRKVVDGQLRAPLPESGARHGWLALSSNWDAELGARHGCCSDRPRQDCLAVLPRFRSPYGSARKRQRTRQASVGAGRQAAQVVSVAPLGFRRGGSPSCRPQNDQGSETASHPAVSCPGERRRGSRDARHYLSKIELAVLGPVDERPPLAGREGQRRSSWVLAVAHRHGIAEVGPLYALAVGTGTA